MTDDRTYWFGDDFGDGGDFGDFGNDGDSDFA